MLEAFFDHPFSINRLRAGPSGPYIDGFAQSLKDIKYARETARRYLRSASHLGRFVELDRKPLACVDGKVLDAFWHHLPRCKCPHAVGGTTKKVVLGARRFVDYLCTIGVANRLDSEGGEKLEPQLVRSFRRWLEQHKKPAESTMKHYCRAAGTLIAAMGDDPAGYEVGGLRAFITEEARQSGSGTIGNLITGSRAFLQYLVSQKKCRSGLDQAIPGLAGWRQASLPESLSADEVSRILEVCDTESDIGIRDRSIILFFARLGLRAGDLAGLRFSDVDWHEGSFVVTGKGGREVRLPLPQEVGEALIGYLECRPQVETDFLYLRSVAPFRPLQPPAVSAIVARAMRRAGVTARSYGSHILRHSTATQMLNEGASLYEVGAVLRHRSYDMTAYYAKVDVKLLREVAQPWPEVLTC